MPSATRKGDCCSGHDSCPPRPLAEGSANVFFNGKPAARAALDQYAVHGCKDHPTHSAVIEGGSSNVFINGFPAARVGDSVSCGGQAQEGSKNIFIGG